MKPRQLVLGIALALAAGSVLFGDRAPAESVVEPVSRPAQASAHRAALKPAAAAEVAILRLQPRATLLGGPVGSFKAGSDNAFASRNWTPPPPPPPPAPAPQAPVAPPLPFTFIGKSLEEGTWEVYLMRGERTYVLREKDMVDGSYRVESIKPPLMTLTYLPLGQVQQLNIGVFD